MHKLISDHCPIIIQIDMTRRQTKDSTNIEMQRTDSYTVIDIIETKKRILEALLEYDPDTVLLEDINRIMSSAIIFKTKQHKPIKFWTPELKKALRLQIKARKAIGKSRRKQENTEVPYRLYIKAQEAFRKMFTQAKKRYKEKNIKKACQVITGARFLK